jgi:tetratricopeptide (TPR) repeat protein
VATTSASTSSPAGVPQAAWLALLLVPLVVVAFAPILPNGFVGWDDPLNFLENRDFRGLGWPQLRWAWTTRLLGVYQPLSWMLLEAEYAIGGLDPRVYHLTSLVLFCGVALVLHALVVALLRRSGAEAVEPPWLLHASAAAAVALFVAHPLRVEVVAWVSCQPYLPAALLAMLAIVAYLKAHPASGPTRLGWAIAAFGLFVAALLCKAVAIPVPLVLLILDVYPLRRLAFQKGRLFGRSTWPCWLEKLPYLALSALFAVIAFKAKQENESLVTAPALADLPERFSQACYGFWIYPAMTFWPQGITAFYPLPPSGQWNEARFVLARLLLIATVIVLIALRRAVPGLLAAWLAYLAVLAPNSGLVRIGNQIAADRYSFVAMLCLVPVLAVALAAALRPSAGSRRPVIVLVILAAALLAEVGLTRRQCAIWHDSISLWTHSLEHGAATDYSVLNNLGYSLTLDGRPAEAVPYLQQALRGNSNDVNAHHSLGATYMALGRDSDAAAEFREALRLVPGHPDSVRDLARVLARQPQRAHAVPVPPGR